MPSPSCLAVTGVCFLVVTLIIATVSLATPCWITSNDKEVNAGLWQMCHKTGCIGFTNATALPGFLNVTRTVFTVSVANIMVALFICIGYLSCDLCKQSLRALQVMVIVMLVGCMEATVSVIMYIMQYDNTDYLDLPSGSVHLSWSFYLGGATLGLLVVNMVLFICETSHAINRQKYQKMRTDITY